MAAERRTVEDCLGRVAAARSAGLYELARYWREEARHAARLQLSLATEDDRASLEADYVWAG